jgi:hypothetical protein
MDGTARKAIRTDKCRRMGHELNLLIILYALHYPAKCEKIPGSKVRIFTIYISLLNSASPSVCATLRFCPIGGRSSRKALKREEQQKV